MGDPARPDPARLALVLHGTREGSRLALLAYAWLPVGLALKAAWLW